MGTGKREAARKERQGKSGNSADNVRVKGENFYRTAKKVKTLNIYKDGKAQRNAQGKISQAASFQSRDKPSGRVEPNRKWFTNTRVISQDSLTAFREAMVEKASDPYSYLLKQNKLPMSLIHDAPNKNGLKEHRAKITTQTFPFSDTFGPKAQRKRVNLNVTSLEDLAGETSKTQDEYQERLVQGKVSTDQSANDEDHHVDENGETQSSGIAREPIFSKGKSKRIWNELYKVIDSSDVIINVLDARDPIGTRCHSVEKYMREEAPHKHLLFVLNKCDLVPTSAAASWVRTLSKEYPTLAFHASMTNSFGKGSLIQLLRQFSSLHSERKQITVGFIGYPNVGKSSVINTLRKKKVCTVAPIPGETKVWQYIALMKRIYLLDCPGVVPPNMNDTDEDLLLRGVVRVENVESPEQYVAAALKKCKTHHVERTYEIKGFTNANEFLELLARKSGRLLKGSEPDTNGVAKMVLNDFIRGKIPWFTPPPVVEGEEASGIEGREGRLGEMSRKRKREDGEEDEPAERLPEKGDIANDEGEVDEDDEEFEGFDQDSKSQADEEADARPTGGVRLTSAEAIGVSTNAVSVKS